MGGGLGQKEKLPHTLFRKSKHFGANFFRKIRLIRGISFMPRLCPAYAPTFLGLEIRLNFILGHKGIRFQKKILFHFFILFCKTITFFKSYAPYAP